MTDSNNKHSHSFFSNAFGVAKKISATGMGVLNHVASDRVAKVMQPSKNGRMFEGSSRHMSPFESPKYENPQQMLREYLPNVSK